MCIIYCFVSLIALFCDWNILLHLLNIGSVLALPTTELKSQFIQGAQFYCANLRKMFFSLKYTE